MHSANSAYSAYSTGAGYDYADFDAFLSGDSEEHPRTLYIGNLDFSVSEELLSTLFSQLGTVTKCKIIHEAGNDPYAFMEFQNHSEAVQALSAMNKRVLMGREMKVNWATTPGQQAKVDTSRHFHVFVGDLSPEIDNKTLRDAFSPFGQISDAKVIRDLQTLKSKGYGFVSYVNREDAEKSIEQMNGQWLGRRTIRTNWATRKPTAVGPKQLSFEEVFQQSGPQNSTVYVGNSNPNVTEQQLREAFAQFGEIVEVRIFKQQGYCFVRFDTKEQACHAICNMNGAEIAGSPVRCSWGREDGGVKSYNPSSTPTQSASSVSSGSSYTSAAAAAATVSYPANYANYWAQYYQYYNSALYQQYAATGVWPQAGGTGSGAAPTAPAATQGTAYHYQYPSQQ